MSWRIMTKDGKWDSKTKALFDEAIAAAPSNYVTRTKDGITTPDPMDFLPRKSITGRCRICGIESKLTQEHLPTKASGNKLTHTNLVFDDWLKYNVDASSSGSKKTSQGGIFGYTLCKSCNDLTGRLYGNEYKLWVKKATDHMNSYAPGTLETINTGDRVAGDKFVFGDKQTGPVKPGLFIRQVLSFMCSLSGPWFLSDIHPQLRKIILEQKELPLPTLDLVMNIYVGPNVRIIGPQLQVNSENGLWRWVQEIAFPPFAFELTLASNQPETGKGIMLNDYSLMKLTEEKYLELILKIGYGWSPYPGDYRTKGEILAGRDS